MKMSKTRRKMCVIILLALLLVPAVQASAVSQTFFTNKTCQGFSCSASGTINQTDCYLYFTATPLPTTPVQPWENYTSNIEVYTYSSDSSVAKSHEYLYGNCTHTEHLTPSSKWIFGKVKSKYFFQGTAVMIPWYTITNQ